MDIHVEIDETKEGRVSIQAPAIFKNLVDTIPGRHYNSKERYWDAPLSYPVYLMLLGTFGHRLVVGEKYKKWIDDTYQNQIYPSLIMRDQPSAEGYSFLYPHQNADVRFLTNIERGILASGLGSGKSRSAAATVRRLYEMGKNPFPVLIVCPNSTKISWKREIEAVWPELKTVVVSGSMTQRRRQIKEFVGEEPCLIHNPPEDYKPKGKKKPVCTCKGHILIMNWESLRSHSKLAPWGNVSMTRCQACGGADPKVSEAQCHAHPKELNHIEFNTVIADEVHKIKDPSTHMARSLRAATGDAKYRIAMTGTPIANSVVDLWSTLNWLYPESFPAKSRFIDRYLISSLNPYGAMTILGIQENMRQELFNIIDPILRRMPKEVILPFLPPVVYEKRYVDMGTKQAKAYDQMQKRMVALLDDDQMVVSVNPVTKMLRMLQFASSYATAEDIKYIDPETGHEKTKTEVTLAEPSAKLDAFIDDLEEFEGHSIVVFTPFKQLLDLLGARLEKLGIPYGRITGDESSIERQVHMDNFQQGLIKIILATPGAGGTGITLTKADIAVYLGRPWSNIDSEQSEGRIHRLGSEIHDKITYIDYISSNTVEDKVFDALDRKGYTLQEILRDEEIINKLIRNEDIDDKQ